MQMGRARPGLLEKAHLGALFFARIGGHALLTAKVVLRARVKEGERESESERESVCV